MYVYFIHNCDLFLLSTAIRKWNLLQILFKAVFIYLYDRQVLAGDHLLLRDLGLMG
jgi:hypothetical protein